MTDAVSPVGVREPGRAPIRPRLGGGPSRATVLLLAVVVGAAVANIYYAQPLLPVIGKDLGVGESRSALLVTASQVGYALALALLVPLGDLLERRRLVTVLLVATALGLAAASVAPTFGALVAALVVVGMTAAVAQIIVPFAASLATDATRGRVVGTVMSGLLIGILVARTAAGTLAGFGGWRLVFATGAGLMLVLAVAVRLRLPPAPSVGEMIYPRLLASVLHLIRGDAVLRQRMVLGAVGMGCFTILWTSISFLLAGPPFGFSPSVIGAFGLAGLAGALMAPLAGRLADRGRTRQVVTVGLALLVVSWGVLDVGRHSVAGLVLGIILLDLAQQALQISHQSTIYARGPEARSRVTTAYMVAVFGGGTLASAATSVTYGADGWSGVTALGAALAVLGLVFWLVTERIRTKPGRS